jgi:hypothetical protein
MGTDRTPRRGPAGSKEPAPPPRQRIPLPPLPAFRGAPATQRPAAPGAPPEPARSAVASARTGMASPRSAVAPPARGPAVGSRGVGTDEAEMLAGPSVVDGRGGLPPGPGHEGRPSPLQDVSGSGRSGVLGATILNDLVDEIERDLEFEVSRHGDAIALPAYRRTAGCSFTPPPDETREVMEGGRTHEEEGR